MNFSLLNLVILWAISVYLGFRLGREQKHQKKKIKKPATDSIEIKRIKRAEKDFWYFDGTINQNDNKN